MGGGTSGYLTVLYLAKNFPEMKIDWIFPEDGETIGVGEATVPYVKKFMEDLGIDLPFVIKELNGSLKLGIKFEGFGEEAFYHPFGEDEEQSSRVEWMMKNNKVNLTDIGDIASHFDVGELQKVLLPIIKALPNVNCTHSQAEYLSHLEHDLVVDSTGFKRQFISQAIKDNFKPLNSIPNNRAFVCRVPYNDNIQVPYTTCTALGHGWVWSIPLGDKISFGYVHDSKYGDKIITSEFNEFLAKKGYTNNEFRVVNMTTGRNKTSLIEAKQTIVAIGLSGSFIEPLESTGLYLVCNSIDKLGKYLRHTITAQEYNTMINNEFDYIAEFILAHYKFAKNTGEYWDDFKEKSSVILPSNIFPPQSWHYILNGLGQRKYKFDIDLKKLIDVKKNGVTCKEWCNNL